MKDNKKNIPEVVMNEVELDEKDIMEETMTPALGGVCGLGCGGALCGFWC